MSRKSPIHQMAIFTAASSVTMVAGNVLAQIDAGPGTGISTTVSVDENTQGQSAQGFPLPTGQFDLGPLTVSYSSTSGAIDKKLHDDEDRNGDGVINAIDFALLASTTLNLNETIVVGNGTSWTDWEETMETPGISWDSATATLAGSGPIPGLAVSVTPTQVAFTFDPLPAGTVLDIDKQFSITSKAALPYVLPDFGTVVPNGTVDYGTIDVEEYPTSVPEPASTGVMVVGGVALLAMRNRRRA